ncbi:hypothetical protein BCL67_10845 [Nesterenkonia sandarakina]|uniref:PKD domain-containing protein n=1 Tax=Nesterenkonia sandarakina TaxID=272918 RepID=A0A2T0YK53_9MICC|nr:hypothetical protein BCL67_10845 [Nesterenkonia sandarakina]
MDPPARDAGEGGGSVAFDPRPERPRTGQFIYCQGAAGNFEADCREQIVQYCDFDAQATNLIDAGDGELGYGCQYEPEIEEIAEIEDPEIAAQDDLADILELLPGEVQRAFTTLPIAGGSVEFEPDLLGFGYRNRHTHMFADVGTQTLNQTLLGIPVEIRVNPQSFLWNYGDGTSRVTYDPGEPMPDSWQGEAVVKTDQETPTSHVYSETGRFPVGLTTTFVGEYRVGGGPWIVIPGSVDVQASPGEADIWRVAARNVSGSCRNTVDWGCNGPVTLEPGDTPPKIFADQYDANGNWLGD